MVMVELVNDDEGLLNPETITGLVILHSERY